MTSPPLRDFRCFKAAKLKKRWQSYVKLHRGKIAVMMNAGWTDEFSPGEGKLPHIYYICSFSHY